VVGDFLNLTVTKTNGSVVSVSATNLSGSATFNDFVQSFFNAINAQPSLQSPDGVGAENLVTGTTGLGDPIAVFNLLPRAPGLKASQIQALLTGSFTISPLTVSELDENINDLRPRNHLYVTAGLTNLPVTFGFNTTTQADGWHELTAVAYKGDHVRTQKRISQTIRITNSTLSATFTSLLGGTNTALEATLQFAVVANTNNITKIELFTTGGLYATSNNVSSATFAVPAAYLGIGLHPFYALVTRADGRQFRTRTEWIRIIGSDLPFSVTATGLAPTLTWPATAGRSYQILSATNVTETFTVRDALTPTNSTGLWSETNNSTAERFYRVKTP
jgi:hypothetical protein